MLQDSLPSESDFILKPGGLLGQPFQKGKFNGDLSSALFPFNGICRWMPQPSLYQFANWRVCQSPVLGTCLHGHFKMFPAKSETIQTNWNTLAYIYHICMYACLSACTICMWVFGYYPRIHTHTLSLSLSLPLSLSLCQSVYLSIDLSISVCVCVCVCELLPP